MYERKTIELNISDRMRNIIRRFETKSAWAHLLLRRIPKEILLDNYVDYIDTATDSGRISYLTKERISIINPAECYNSGKRYQCRAGSFLSKVFKGVSDRDMEEFSNYYRTFAIEKNVHFEIIKGEQMRQYYNANSYLEMNGSLGVSCMKYDRCTNYFELYIQNPEIVSMLVLLNPRGQLVGRALLWEFINEEDGNVMKIMDRVYNIRVEEFNGLFFEWAQKNGYYHKAKQAWYDTIRFITPSGELIEKEITLKLNKFQFDQYPYLDTFKWLNYKTGYIRNYLHEEAKQQESYNRVLTKDNGSFEFGSWFRFDTIHRQYRQSHDICTTVEGFDTYTSNCMWSDVNQHYMLNENTVYNDVIDDYIHKNNEYNNAERIEQRTKECLEYRERMKDKIASKSKSKSKLVGDPWITFDYNLYTRVQGQVVARDATAGRPIPIGYPDQIAREQLRQDTGQQEQEAIAVEVNIQNRRGYINDWFHHGIAENLVDTEIDAQENNVEAHTQGEPIREEAFEHPANETTEIQNVYTNIQNRLIVAQQEIGRVDREPPRYYTEPMVSSTEYLFNIDGPVVHVLDNTGDI